MSAEKEWVLSVPELYEFAMRMYENWKIEWSPQRKLRALKDLVELNRRDVRDIEETATLAAVLHNSLNDTLKKELTELRNWSSRRFIIQDSATNPYEYRIRFNHEHPEASGDIILVLSDTYPATKPLVYINVYHHIHRLGGPLLICEHSDFWAGKRVLGIVNAVYFLLYRPYNGKGVCDECAAR